MSEKIHRELRVQLQKAAAAHDASLLSFIVQLKPGTRAADVLPGKIEHEFEAISGASCKMTAGQALELLKHPAVRAVEMENEGDVHILKGQGPAE